MVKLESIIPGVRLAGVIGDQRLEIVATRTYGPDSLEGVWRGPDGLRERIFDPDLHRRRLARAPRNVAAR